MPKFLVLQQREYLTSLQPLYYNVHEVHNK